jgi:hypothetical protein
MHMSVLIELRARSVLGRVRMGSPDDGKMVLLVFIMFVRHPQQASEDDRARLIKLAARIPVPAEDTRFWETSSLDF